MVCACMKNAAIYCRVSTEDQEREGSSLDSQKDACLLKARDLGYDVPQHSIFIETFSGLTVERPQLTKLRDKAKSSEIQAIIVLKPDRLSRVGEDILTLAKEFKTDGVKLLFVKEQWDDTPQGKIVAFAMGWAAEMYVAATVEATTRAKDRLVKEKGIMPQGTGIGLYGYRWDSTNKKRIPLEYETKVVQKIFTLMDEGIGFFNIAKILNEQGIRTKSGSKWHPFTVKRMLTNTSYIGFTYFGKTSGSKKTKLILKDEREWVLLPDVTPPIIDEELFWRVQEKIKRSREMHAAIPHREYLLTGHIVCAKCGSPVVGACLSRKHRYYRCRSTSPTAAKGKTCNARYIRADYIEDVVWENVKKVLEHPEVIIAELKRQADERSKISLQEPDLNQEIANLGKHLRSYEKQERQLILLLRHQQVTKDYVLDEINKLKREREADQEELKRLKETRTWLSHVVDAEANLSEFCQRIRQNLENADIQDKRLALDALDIRIKASAQSIDIKGVIPIEIKSMPSSTDVTTTGQTSA